MNGLRLLIALALAALAAGRAASGGARGYAPEAADTAGPAPVAERRDGTDRTGLPFGAEIGGFLSPRGLPPLPGRFIVTDSALVFHSADGRLAQAYPLIGPVRLRDGRRSRAPMVSLAYADSTLGRPVYVFRVDGGVFGTDAPGPLLDVARQPAWLDSVIAREWRPDRPLVSLRDTAAMWLVTRTIERRSTPTRSFPCSAARPARPAW